MYRCDKDTVFDTPATEKFSIYYSYSPLYTISVVYASYHLCLAIDRSIRLPYLTSSRVKEETSLASKAFIIYGTMKTPGAENC